MLVDVGWVDVFVGCLTGFFFLAIAVMSITQKQLQCFYFVTIELSRRTSICGVRERAWLFRNEAKAIFNLGTENVAQDDVHFLDSRGGAGRNKQKGIGDLF